jgi:putative ABC transport system substrate-binding protein
MPIERGLVASFNRPSGNITGMVFDNVAVTAKRVELLHELVPGAKTIAFLTRPTDRGGAGFTETDAIAARAAAAALGLQIHLISAASAIEINAAFASLAQKAIEALALDTDPFFFVQRNQIVALARRYRIAVSGHRREIVDAGGLMSYGANIPDGYRKAGLYAARIIRGEKPADLPVQAPTKFELVINAQTARMLDLSVPDKLLALADEVIE